MRYGLVLGAGGATAWVFHTGVIQTLHQEAGLDPNTAELIVGTSAGAAVGATMRAGLDVAEVFQAATRPPTQEQRSAMLEELKSSKKTLRPLSPGLARHALPGGRGLTLALSGMIPPGWFPTDWLASFPGMSLLTSWPDGLWVPATRAADGEVVVFGRDQRNVSVADAVAASSAVPGMFRPKVIDSVSYVDGGVTSPTHADLLVGSGVDLAIVSAPMAKPSRRLFARQARKRLEAEVAALERAGIKAVVVEPSAAAMEAARGFPRRRPEAAGAIVHHAVAATRLALASVG
ncbi:MAG: patatin-like phospholipase family protein [Acidimicrobiia bacterium]|nr:patatin-like phospholipase family protein [Acidimicrobiia bacterium]